MAYFAKAPLVIVRGSDSRDAYVYQGMPLPEGVAKDTIASLIEGELIVSDEADLLDAPVKSEPVKAAAKSDK